MPSPIAIPSVVAVAVEPRWSSVTRAVAMSVTLGVSLTVGASTVEAVPGIMAAAFVPSFVVAAASRPRLRTTMMLCLDDDGIRLLGRDVFGRARGELMTAGWGDLATVVVRPGLLTRGLDLELTDGRRVQLSAVTRWPFGSSPRDVFDEVARRAAPKRGTTLA